MRRSLSFSTFVVLGLLLTSRALAASYSTTSTIVVGDVAALASAPTRAGVSNSSPVGGASAGPGIATWVMTGPLASVDRVSATAFGAGWIATSRAALWGPPAWIPVRSRVGPRQATGSDASGAVLAVSDVTPVQIAVAPTVAFVGTSSSFDVASGVPDVTLRQPVPGPATLLLVAGGLGGLTILGTRRRS